MTDNWLNAVYSDYHAWKGWPVDRDTTGELNRATAELRMAGVAPPARLLEIGFGDGTFLCHAKSLGYDCAGMERDPSAVKNMKTRGIDARIAEATQFADRQFDIIAAFDVFEHIAIPELIELLRHCAALLSENGRVVARFPNMASPFGLVNQHGDITHITPLSPASLSQLARLSGLEPVYIANGATVFGSERPTRRIIKALSLGTRKFIEAVFSFAYYGRITPLSPSVVIVLQKAEK